MQREFKEVGSLAEMTHIAESDQELQHLMRVYLPPAPYMLVAVQDGRRMTIKSVLRPEFAQVQVAKAPSHPLGVSPETTPVTVPPIQGDNGVFVQAMAGLEGKSQNDLITIGGELGLDLKKSQSKAHMAAEIARVRAERAAK